MSDAVPISAFSPVRRAAVGVAVAAAAIGFTLACDAAFQPGGTPGDLVCGWALAAVNAAATAVLHRKAMNDATRGFVRAAIGGTLLRIAALAAMLFVFRWMRGQWPARFWLALGAGYIVFLALEIVRLHRLPAPQARPPA